MPSGKTVVCGVLALGFALASAPAREGDVEARIRQLEERIDSLYRSMPTYSRQGEGEAGLRQTFSRRREVYREIRQLEEEYIRLSLGPERARRYDEYLRRREELNQQYRQVWRDSTLSAKDRKARAAAIREEQAALDKQYAEVVRQAREVRDRLHRRRQARLRLQRLQALLKMKEEEWKVLEPRLNRVLQLMSRVWQIRSKLDRRTLKSRLRWWFAAGVASPLRDLRAVLDDKGASPARIKQKLDAFYRWRRQQEEELERLTRQLEAAREELRGLLTLRQEAILVLEGVL